MSKLKNITSDGRFNEILNDVLKGQKPLELLNDLKFLKTQLDSYSKNELKLLKAYSSGIESKFKEISFIMIIVSITLSFNGLLIKDLLSIGLVYAFLGFLIFLFAFGYVLHNFLSTRARITLFKEIIENKLNEQK